MSAFAKNKGRLRSPLLSSPNSLTIRPLDGASGIRHFLDVPDLVYADDPNWVAPLRSEVTKLLDQKKNPFFEHGRARFWLAWRGSRPVGRISAQVNQVHLDRHQDGTGNFGFFEAIDDQQVFDALLATAEDWLRAQGMRRVVGPYSLTINDDIGVLISGFDTPPMALMAHSPPYYAPRLEQAGYRKVKDLYAYRIYRDAVNFDAIARLDRVSERVRSKHRITIRTLDWKNFNRDMHELLSIYNEAWRDNWGFIPVTDKEADLLVSSIKQIIRPELVAFAEMDHRTVGVLATIPNINESIADLRGRLFPFGWAKLLWRLRFDPPKSVRFMLAGVRPEFRNSAMSGTLMSMMLGKIIHNLLATPAQSCELSWILEDNKASLAISQLFGELAKTYRIYEKELAPVEGAAV